MKLIDFKSLLIGILGTALVMFLMGVSSENKIGKYAVACSGVATSHHCIVIDTRNGEAFRSHDLWRVKNQ